ncbi:hypothetical protein BDW02DRAFT_568561 [Decorospora gaudefroyi]|uniref:Uncharacterized protein n=1 Tax=Decorospora gaudefroyi TaxID=184978 RepID=A0A6A5KMX1_9PLEO|nr:hypothetical protein BDW02DRAFT_568561 [Decorospora gaudefroyi]
MASRTPSIPYLPVHNPETTHPPLPPSQHTHHTSTPPAPSPSPSPHPTTQNPHPTPPPQTPTPPPLFPNLAKNRPHFKR